MVVLMATVPLAGCLSGGDGDPDPVITVVGCTDATANNYKQTATQDDGSCDYDLDDDGILDADEISGCTYSNALNYDPLATDDDGSCQYDANTYNPTINCGPAGDITIAGSSTVLPLAEAWAEYYNRCADISITVEGGGSSTGAGRVCANSEKGTPVDIGDMSRDWKTSEADRSVDGYTMQCLKGDSSRLVKQIVVAIDGLSVVMKKGGAAETCVNSMGGLTTDELRWIFSDMTAAQLTAEGWSGIANSDGDDSTHKWSELDSSCPAAEIVLAYPDEESGTYEYFYEAVLHETGGFRTGTQSADDNVLVNALVGDETAIGYFGYAYFQANQDTLTAAPVQNSDGTMVSPTPATVANGDYNPLSRNLFMNLYVGTLEKTSPFLEYGFSQLGDLAVQQVGYVPLTSSAKQEMLLRLTGPEINCGPDGDISIAGSSTVLPLAEAWAEVYDNSCPGISITVEGGGSSSGAGRVCDNSEKGTPVDIGDMSRDWKGSERNVQANGFVMECLKGDTSRKAAQFIVAFDGLSVVMKKGSAAAACESAMGGFTTDELRWIFSDMTEAQLTAVGWSGIANSDGDDSTHKWSELDSSCPAAEIVLAYPDEESGTYEYFYEAVLHETGGFRTGTQSADDNVLVNALVGDETAIGYFGYAYFQANQDTLEAASILNSEGAYVAPTAATVQDGSYNPLTRPLFMNVHMEGASLAKTLPFLAYGYSPLGAQAVSQVGYVPPSEGQLNEMTLNRWFFLQKKYVDFNAELPGGCGDGGSISIAGSSTVLPLAEAWAEAFEVLCGNTALTVEGGGSSSGAGRVCANSEKGTPVNIGDMSRDWKTSEATRDSNGYTMSCLKGDTSIKVNQIKVAVDGLSVVVKKGGAAESCISGMGGLTVAQLRWIFADMTDAELTTAGLDMASVIPNSDNDDTTQKWSELDSTCPDSQIVLAYPDEESGTFEYFCEAVLHEECNFRTGTQSADDNVLVNALTGDGGAIGYFGFAYYKANQDTLSAIGVADDETLGITDTLATAIIPDSVTVRDGSYSPLSRFLYMNINNDDWDLVRAFMTFAWSGLGSEKINDIGYVPLSSSDWQDNYARFM